MKSRVGSYTSMVTLVAIFGMAGIWMTVDPVQAMPKENEDATNSAATIEKEIGKPQADINPQPGDSIRLSKTERRILQELKAPTKMDYSGVPLRDVLEDVARKHDINIVIYDAAITEAGLSTDNNVDLSLKEHLGREVTLAEALESILRPEGLAYIVEDDVLKVTSRESLASHVVTRAYSIPYIPDLDARERLASHLDSLLRTKQANREAQAEERREQDDEEDATQGGFAMQFPFRTMGVFQDRVVMIAPVMEQKDLQELLRLIYIEP